MDFREQREYWKNREKFSVFSDVAYCGFMCASSLFYILNLIQNIIEKNTGFIIFYSIIIGLNITLFYFCVRAIRGRRRTHKRMMEIFDSIIERMEEPDNGNDRTDEICESK